MGTPVKVATPPSITKLKLAGAWGDLSESLRKPYLWRGLAWFDVKQRFRRSVLGPLWITLSMAALIAGMGPLYGAIFDLDLKSYLPFLALGVIVWGFMSSAMTESCNAFITGARVIRQTRLPLSSFVLRTIWRNLIVLAFNSVLIVAVVAYAGVPSLMRVLGSVLGLALLTIAMIGMGFLISVFCTRYRDMQQLVVSMLQILMFLTPVFWRADQLPRRSLIIEWNPAYYFLEAIRAPLLGNDVSLHTMAVAAGLAGCFLLTGLMFFAQYRLRIVYWL